MKFAHVAMSNPGACYQEHRKELAGLAAAAFGRDAEGFEPAAAANFEGSEYGGLILSADQEIVGFTLYRTLDANALWLRGVAVHPSYQGQGLAASALGAAMRGKDTLVAVTRNPATIRLVGSVTRLVCPDIIGKHPLQPLTEPEIAEVYEAHAASLGANPATLPYMFDKYPLDLYGDTDPGANMPFNLIRENPQHALMVVGVV